jgi:hypothetical protein
MAPEEDIGRAVSASQLEECMSLSYAYEKFFTAVMGMASSPKRLRERIEDAFVYEIIHVRDEDIPAAYLSDFRNLKEMLTRRPPRHPAEGSVRATTQQMSWQQTHQAARLITKLFDCISAAQHNEDYEMAAKGAAR